MTSHIPGLIHIHSTYSHDGTMSLREIAALSREKGCRFIALTEHAESMDARKMSDLVSESKALSDADLIVIPGLEYNCEGMHILALGISVLLEGSNQKRLIDAIHSRGGLALLAHVVYYDSIPYGKLEDLDGIEIWNPRYANKFAPSVKSLKILEKFRKRNRNILAFCGLDLHEKGDLCRLRTTVHAEGSSSDDLIKALRKGRFHSKGEIMCFDSQKEIGRITWLTIYSMDVFYRTVEKAVYLLKALGIKPPEKVSKRIRSMLR